MNYPSVYNRVTKEVELERTYQIEGLAFLYQNTLGRFLTNSILKRRFVSNWYARHVKSPKSVPMINKFIEHYNINMGEVEREVSSFKTFNDFFIRTLKPEARPVDMEPHHLISPADARLIIFDLEKDNAIPVKGYWHHVQDFLGNYQLPENFTPGYCFIYRLAPADYHRYAYIDNGSQDKVIPIDGILHSVHPLALKSTNALLAKNYRELTVLHTEQFGDVLHLEVGALLVGRIVQQHNGPHTFKRGEEKGYFEYGGSTVVQIFNKGAITPDADLLEQSAKNIEILVKVGEKVGVRG